MNRDSQFFMVRNLPCLAASVSVCLMGSVSGDPANSSKVLGSQSCSTSGCHGGAGLNRGAFTIWKGYDPHFGSAATLSNGRSRAMAAQLGIENAAESVSCTSCHSPNQAVNPSMFAHVAKMEDDLKSVSCANCHGGAEDWLLSHTRPDYPRAALAKLGMRQLGSAYQRANNCVACHQNLSDDLLEAQHPPLVFELDGLLVAEPKHWREDEKFSHTQTWLVGQAVALREAAAQAEKQPGDARTAEIEAIKALLKATDTGWDGSKQALVTEADNFAMSLSMTPMDVAKTRAILIKLLENRAPFHPDAFASVDEEHRSWAKGFYAERLVLGIDRLNQSLVASGQGKTISKAPLDDLFDAAKPPKGFDSAAAEHFVDKLDIVSELFISSP